MRFHSTGGALQNNQKWDRKSLQCVEIFHVGNLIRQLFTLFLRIMNQHDTFQLNA